MTRYPLPQTFLSIETESEKERFITNWRQKFPSFENYFNSKGLTGIITSAFECLIKVSHMRDDESQIFSLISIFEGLFFSENFNHRNKKRAISHNFSKFCTKYQKNWPFQGDTLTSQDLKEFIEIAYELRNNLAHPEQVRALERKPLVMFKYSNGPLKEDALSHLKRLITEYFPLFIRFALETFFALGFGDADQWYQFLKTV